MKIRPAERRDRDRIHQVLIATGRFNADEVRCAIDLVDQAFDHPERGEYLIYVLEDPDSGPRKMIQGYVCFGQVLLKFVENEVKRQRGRMLLIETSSKESYAPTIRFYQRSGYDEISRIKDFYRIEDDKVVFCKKLLT